MPLKTSIFACGRVLVVILGISVYSYVHAVALDPRTDPFSYPEIRQFSNIDQLEKILDSYKTTRVPPTETPIEEVRDSYESISSVFPKLRRSILKMYKESDAAKSKHIVAAISIIPCKKSAADCKQSDFTVIDESDDVFVVKTTLKSDQSWKDLCEKASLDRPVMTAQFTHEIDNKSLPPIIYYMFICANYMDQKNIVSEARKLALCHEDSYCFLIVKAGLLIICVIFIIFVVRLVKNRRRSPVRSAGEAGIRLQPPDEEPANDQEPKDD